MTPLHYVSNFRPQRLGAPLDQILDPHLEWGGGRVDFQRGVGIPKVVGISRGIGILARRQGIPYLHWYWHLVVATSGQYVFYWNAFLLIATFTFTLFSHKSQFCICNLENICRGAKGTYFLSSSNRKKYQLWTNYIEMLNVRSFTWQTICEEQLLDNI